MKKSIAKRRLTRKCDYCNKTTFKGEVYYKDRTVIVEWGEIFAYTIYTCPKCKYKRKQSKLRFEKFKGKCEHPEEFTEEIWTYIPGEAVKEPSHRECRLCKAII